MALAPDLPGPPTGVQSGTITTSSIVVFWTAPVVSPSPTSYKWEYKRSVDTAFITSSVTTLTGTQSGLTAGTSYDFRVSAVNAAGPSAPSAIFSVTTAPATGGGLTESAHAAQVTTTNGQLVDQQLNVWTMVASATGVPAAASAVGYTNRTFGPALSLGGNWQKWASNVNATQNANGSITTTGGNNTFGLNVITALPTGGAGWSGTTWTGGAYFEWTMSFTGTPNPTSIANGWPSLWIVDMEGPGFTDGSQAHWQGQGSNFYRWATINVAEWANDHSPMPAANTVYHEFSDFYADPGSNTQVETGYHANGSPYVVPSGFSFAQPHKYAFLWVPATNTTQGFARYYIDDVRVDTGVAVWNLYNPATPPPPVSGTTAFSFIDARHLAAIFGTGPQNPLTVSAFSVWQRPSGGGGTGSGLQIAINGVLQPLTSNVTLMKYYNPTDAAATGTTKHSVVYLNAAGAWFISTGVNNNIASWAQLAGDPFSTVAPGSGGPGLGPAFQDIPNGQAMSGGQRCSTGMTTVTTNVPGLSRYEIQIKPTVFNGVWRPNEPGNYISPLTAAFVDRGRYLYLPDVSSIFSATGCPAVDTRTHPIAGIRLPICWWTVGTTVTSPVSWGLFYEPGQDTDGQVYAVITDYKASRGDTFHVTGNMAGKGVVTTTSWGSILDFTGEHSDHNAAFGLGWVAFIGHTLVKSAIIADW